MISCLTWLSCWAATGNLLRPLRDVVKAFHRVTERAGQGISMLHRSMGTSGAGLHRSGQRALVRELLAEGDARDGLGIAIGAGLRVAHQKVPRFAIAIARQELGAAELHELIDCRLYGCWASKVKELRHERSL